MPKLTANFFYKKPKTKIIKLSKFIFNANSFILIAFGPYLPHLRIFKYKEYLRQMSPRAYKLLPNYFNYASFRSTRVSLCTLITRHHRFYRQDSAYKYLNIEKLDSSKFLKTYRTVIYKLKAAKLILKYAYDLSYKHLKDFSWIHIARLIRKVLIFDKDVFSIARIHFYRINTVYSFLRLIGFNYGPYMGRYVLKDIINNTHAYPIINNLLYIYNTKSSCIKVSNFLVMRRLNSIYINLIEYFERAKFAALCKFDLLIWVMIRDYFHLKFVKLLINKRKPQANFMKKYCLFNLDYLIWESLVQGGLNEKLVGNSQKLELLRLNNNLNIYLNRFNLFYKKLGFFYLNVHNEKHHLKLIFFDVLQSVILKIVYKNKKEKRLSKLGERKLFFWGYSNYSRVLQYALAIEYQNWFKTVDGFDYIFEEYLNDENE